MKAQISEGRNVGSTTVPVVAVALGAAGLIPFLGASAALLFESPATRAFALNALIVYAAVILAFMGAVHWGLALRSPEQLRDAQAWWFGLSIVPALIGWVSALLAFVERPLLALLLLATGFILAYVADVKSVQSNIAPGWYSRLRRPLTTVVLLCLGAAGIGLLAAS